MTNLSKAVRTLLEENFSIGDLPVIDSLEDPSDGTHKLLLQLPDGEGIESVIMPQFSKVETNVATGAVKNFKKEEIKEYTICVSTQAGCMYACRFCASGQMGFKRNLTAGEIIAQLMVFLRTGYPVNRMVLMGMGEPLQNWDAVKKAIEILSNENGLGFSKRRFTISTVGMVPEIYRMAEEDWNVKLAVSLHATTDEKRAELIPMAQAYQLDQLMDALRFYQRRESRRVSFEYLMLDGFNDTPADAQRLKNLTTGLKKVHVNLIPYNPIPSPHKPKELTSPVHSKPLKPSSPDKIQQFKAALLKFGLDATIRFSRGRQIEGACGQLRLHNRYV